MSQLPLNDALDFPALAAGWPEYTARGASQALSALHQYYLEFYRIDLIASGQAEEYRFGTIAVAEFQIAVQSWQPVGAALGTVFVVHGYWDHVGLYRHLIAQCLAAGFAVIAFDEPGHGLSSGERAAIDSFHQYTEVLNRVVAVAECDTQRPMIGIGQSTGGAVLLDYFFTHERPFADTLLLAPLVRAHRWGWVVTGHRVLSPVLKKFPRDMSICGSHDPSYAQFLQADPLQYRYASGRWIGAMRQWVQDFLSYPSKPGHMLYIQGDRDVTVDWQFNLAAVRARVPQLEVDLLPGAFHNLVNESDEYRLPVLARVSERLASHRPN